MHFGRVLLLCWSATGMLVAFPANAHTENSDGFSTIRIGAGRVSYDLLLDYFELGRLVKFGVGRSAPSSDLRYALERHREELEAYIGRRLQVSIDGVSCPVHLANMALERRFDRDYARLGLEFSCPGSHSGGARVKYDLFFDDSDSSHRNLVSHDADGGQEPFVFTAVQRELKIGRGTLSGQALRFLELGFGHILTGYDHILFVIALLLGTSGLASVMGSLSAFTLAHSVTLATAILGIAQFSPTIVEPLIALSIAYVAAENLQGSASHFRLPVVFGFGLVHGMGFSDALQITGTQGWNLAVPLVSFNLGIELGQALIVLLILPLLWVLRKFSWSSLVHHLAHGSISLFGLGWYFLRLMS
jgi:hypothetical protein